MKSISIPLICLFLILFGGCRLNNLEHENKKRILDYYYFEQLMRDRSGSNEKLRKIILQKYPDRQDIANRITTISRLREQEIKYLSILAEKVIIYTEGHRQEDMLKLTQLDNYDKPSEFLVGDIPWEVQHGKWSAYNLKNRLEKFNHQMAIYIYHDKKYNWYLSLSLNPIPRENGAMESWEAHHFYSKTLSSCVIRMKFLQYQILQTEEMALVEIARNGIQ